MALNRRGFVYRASAALMAPFAAEWASAATPIVPSIPMGPPPVDNMVCGFDPGSVDRGALVIADLKDGKLTILNLLASGENYDRMKAVAIRNDCQTSVERTAKISWHARAAQKSGGWINEDAAVVIK